MFKEGDIVRCVNIENPVIDTVKMLIVGEIYLISNAFGLDYKTVKINTEFGKFNTGYNHHLGGFHSYRFNKVSKKDLTKEEIFEITKYKLGIKENTNGKKEKRTRN